MARKTVTLTGGQNPTVLSFSQNQDGTVTMEVTDPMGGGSSRTYLASRPGDLIREGRVYQSPQGALIQTGIVLAKDGTGRGVAWRIDSTR